MRNDTSRSIQASEPGYLKDTLRTSNPSFMGLGTGAGEVARGRAKAPSTDLASMSRNSKKRVVNRALWYTDPPAPISDESRLRLSPHRPRT